MKYIEDLLRKEIDEKYAEFQRSLIPNIDPDSILGVRTPILRKLAKRIAKEEVCTEFLQELPHQYYEELQLHSFILAEMKNYEECLQYVNEFLPYIDNWAVCDQAFPKVFGKKRDKIKSQVIVWIKSESTKPYIIRYGIGAAMRLYLENDDFDVEIMKLIASIRSEEYYVNMMIAWYFATALAKQWEDTIGILEDHKLDIWVHNKTIQKARESFRITEEQKEYLKTIKLK